MDKQDDSGRDARRKFLKSLALTGGGAAVAVKMGGAVAAETGDELEQRSEQPEGYHLTPHIRDYYAKAQF